MSRTCLDKNNLSPLARCSAYRLYPSQTDTTRHLPSLTPPAWLVVWVRQVLLGAAGVEDAAAAGGGGQGAPDLGRISRARRLHASQHRLQVLRDHQAQHGEA